MCGQKWPMAHWWGEERRTNALILSSSFSSAHGDEAPDAHGFVAHVQQSGENPCSGTIIPAEKGRCHARQASLGGRDGLGHHETASSRDRFRLPARSQPCASCASLVLTAFRAAQGVAGCRGVLPSRASTGCSCGLAAMPSPLTDASHAPSLVVGGPQVPRFESPSGAWLLLSFSTKSWYKF